jgi:hypothetical protein
MYEERVVSASLKNRLQDNADLGYKWDEQKRKIDLTAKNARILLDGSSV